MYTGNQANIGSFKEKEFGGEFTYRKTTDWWAIANGYEYEIDVGGLGEVRFAHIKKTVAYVLCDAPEGNENMVEQKWLIKNTPFVVKG